MKSYGLKRLFCIKAMTTSIPLDPQTMWQPTLYISVCTSFPCRQWVTVCSYSKGPLPTPTPGLEKIPLKFNSTDTITNSKRQTLTKCLASLFWTLLAYLVLNSVFPLTPHLNLAYILIWWKRQLVTKSYFKRKQINKVKEKVKTTKNCDMESIYLVEMLWSPERRQENKNCLGQALHNAKVMTGHYILQIYSSN